MVLICPRVHFYEIDDQSWFPKYLREKIQSALTVCWTYRVPFLQRVAPSQLVASTISRCLSSTVTEYVYVDFCAGAGGPTPQIEKHLNKTLANDTPSSRCTSSSTKLNGDETSTGVVLRAPHSVGHLLDLNGERSEQGNGAVKFVLTDLHPHIPDWTKAAGRSENLSFVSKSIDAANAPKATELGCPKQKRVFRLYNLAFHHFDDPLARDILRNTLETADGFGIFELQERTISSFITVLFMWPLMILITPFFFWKSPGHLFFTYIIPIIPFVLVFDGIVSSLRARSAEEIQNLMNECGAPRDGWIVSNGAEMHTFPTGYMTWFMGIKK